MRKIQIKFSDERNRKYSIQTTITEDDDTKERFVYKSNIYPEGKVHIASIKQNESLLKEAYPEVKICPVQMTERNGVRFEYITGESLEKRYRNALAKNNSEEMEKLLLLHHQYIIGGENNTCEFVITSEFSDIFGVTEWKGKNSKALKVSNFDATSSNIIYHKEQPVFIDYEWVYDFPIPQDLIIYHCVRDAYLHIDGLEGFYPLKRAMTFLGVYTDIDMMEAAYKNFYKYVSTDQNGISFGLCKLLNLKGTRVFDENEAEKAKLALEFAEKNWKEACQANAVLSQRIPKLETEADKWKKMFEEEQENHKIHAKQIEEAVQEQAKQSETWRIAYETVINSRTWYIIGKMKKFIGRK